MSTVIKSIDVDIPVSTAFDLWTRFEELPRFLRGVVAVQRLDERRLHWRAQIIGVERVWMLELTKIALDRKIAWRSLSGPKNRGAVVLEPLADFGTRVTMQVHYDPASFLAEVTDYLGLLSRWVERGLHRFKALTEPDATLGRLPPAEELVGH